MKTNWQTVAAAEFCSSVRDGTHASPKAAPIGELLITSRHIIGGRVDLSNAYRISREDFDDINRRSKVDRCDVLVSMIGTVGEVCLIRDEPNFAIKNIGLFKSKSELEGKWLYYFLKSPDAQELIRSHSRGSTQQYIPLGALRELSVSFPKDRGEMEAIVETLACVDDKIEQNRRTSRALENLTRATFKAWFVDFEPVKAKAAGQTSFPGMPPSVFATLADRLMESSLGPVPKGWEIAKLGSLCIVGRGSSPRPINNYMGGTVPWIKIADATAAGGPFLYETKEFVTEAGATKSVPVVPGDLILSNSASCGIPIFVGLHGCIHDGWLHFRELHRVSKGFLYHWLHWKSAHLIHIADGSVQKNLNTKLIRDLEFVVPSLNVSNAFAELHESLFKMINLLGHEARKLATLRDYLLPRLLSGRARAVSTGSGNRINKKRQ